MNEDKKREQQQRKLEREKLREQNKSEKERLAEEKKIERARLLEQRKQEWEIEKKRKERENFKNAWRDCNQNYQYFLKSGIKKKKWLLSSDPCSICLANEAVGAIPLHEKFPSGHLHPPAHPGCACDFLAVLEDG